MFKIRNYTILLGLFVPCVIFGLSIYLVSDYIYSSKSYECVNTESISDIEYYNTKDGYKFVNKTVNFIDVDSKIYVMFDKTIPINETFKCFIKNNNIFVYPDSIELIFGLIMLCISVLLIILIIYATYWINREKPYNHLNSIN